MLRVLVIWVHGNPKKVQTANALEYISNFKRLAGLIELSIILNFEYEQNIKGE